MNEPSTYKERFSILEKRLAQIRAQQTANDVKMHRIYALRDLANRFYTNNHFINRHLNRLMSNKRSWLEIYIQFVILDMLHTYITGDNCYYGLLALRITKLSYMLECITIEHNIPLLSRAKSISFTICSCYHCGKKVELEYPEKLQDSFYANVLCEECFESKYF